MLPLLSTLWTVALAEPASPSYFHYERSVSVPEGAAQACAVLDAPVFPHSEPYLKDLRLIPSGSQRSGGDVPYVITLSESLEQDTENTQVLNFASHGHTLEFDLKMPSRPYSDVDLDLAAKDFVATATVTGLVPTGGPVRLGEFTLFDLTSQHLGRGTTLHLSESHFATLHVVLSTAAAGVGSTFMPSTAMVRGATVPPSRDAQSLFTTVAETSAIAQNGSASVAHFVLPERVPVERISIVLAPGFTGNFSRTVRIDDRRAVDPASAGESTVGNIQRVQLTQSGHEIAQQDMSIVTTLGANLQGPADVQVSVENGSAAALPIIAVKLEMRERRLCFDARMAHGGATLFYGDPALAVLRYAYVPVFTPSDKTAVARLGPEVPNPAYRMRPGKTLPLERRQQLLWAGMLIVISTTAMVVFFSSKHPHR